MKKTSGRELNAKEAVIYKYIAKTINERGYSPSVRDIQNAMGYQSTSTVHMYLGRLEEKGYIRKENGKSRTLRLENTENTEEYEIPIIGNVAAGTPILAEQNFDGYLDLSYFAKKYGKDNLFALKIKGESMTGAGILDGDTVVVEKCDFAENGEIIVALIDGEATVKTFYRESGHIRLQPENPTMKPIIVNDITVLGRIVASIRTF